MTSNSALYRIENATDGRSPVAQAAADNDLRQAPLQGRRSPPPAPPTPTATPSRYSWDFGDGGKSTAANPAHTYTEERDVHGDGDRQGHHRPHGRCERPGRRRQHRAQGASPTARRTGSCSRSATRCPFKVKVTDREDGRTIDCTKVKVTFILGHDSHGHPQTSANGCSGTIQTSADGGHDPNANIFGVFDAEYTDLGGGGQAPLTTHDQNVVQPTHRQAEHFNDSSGTAVSSRIGERRQDGRRHRQR